MIKDSVVKRSFFISLFLHIAILIPWPGFSLIHVIKKEEHRIQPVIVAYKIKENEKIEILKQKQNLKPKDEASVNVKYDIPSEKAKINPDPKKIEDDVIYQEKEVYTVKEDEVVSLSEDVNYEIIPESVLNYYSSIREEIRKKALYYKPRFKGRGAVTLLFNIASDGVLQTLSIDTAKSTTVDILQKSAVKSVEYASPFPHFPVELKNDYITFSITIEFELGGS